MSTFNIPILPFFVHIFFKKQLNLTVGENNSTRPSTRKSKPLQDKNNSTQQEKIAQLGSMNETTQLSRRNETTQLGRRKQLNSTEGTKQLDSAPPATACTAFTAESAFLIYLPSIKCKFPTPELAMQPQTIWVPPPYLTVGRKFLTCIAVFDYGQTFCLPSDPNMLYVLSSTKIHFPNILLADLHTF
ncbi:hypothetical protein TNCV_1978821 [Trichonephila clavipes]|nr:hypothetical protein TNCV_1978821 [Trichonephila clavipes]